MQKLMPKTKNKEKSKDQGGDKNLEKKQRP
jgi:hypothetical protein